MTVTEKIKERTLFAQKQMNYDPNLRNKFKHYTTSQPIDINMLYFCTPDVSNIKAKNVEGMQDAIALAVSTYAKYQNNKDDYSITNGSDSFGTVLGNYINKELLKKGYTKPEDKTRYINTILNKLIRSRSYTCFYHNVESLCRRVYTSSGDIPNLDIPSFAVMLYNYYYESNNSTNYSNTLMSIIFDVNKVLYKEDKKEKIK